MSIKDEIERLEQRVRGIEDEISDMKTKLAVIEEKQVANQDTMREVRDQVSKLTKICYVALGLYLAAEILLKFWKP